MKKIKLLVISFVFMITSIGIGYAFWNDSIVINNAIDTGELKVEFIEERGFPYIEAWNYNDEPYLQLSKEHGSKTTTFVIGNMFPGVIVGYEALIENLGTIPAVINNIDVSFYNESSDLLKANLQVSGLVLHVQGANAIAIGDYQNPITLNQLKEELNNKLSGLRLEPGDNLTVELEYYLPSTVGNDLELQTAKFDITFNYKQHNQ